MRNATTTNATTANAIIADSKNQASDAENNNTKDSPDLGVKILS